MKFTKINYNQTTTYMVLLAFQYFQAITFKITINVLLLVRSMRRQARKTIIIHRSKRKRKLIDFLRDYITNCALLYVTYGETFIIDKSKKSLPYDYQLITKFPLGKMSQYSEIQFTEKSTFNYKINFREDIVIKPITIFPSKLKFVGLPPLPL